MNYTGGSSQPPQSPAPGPFVPRKPAGPRRVRHGVKLAGVLQTPPEASEEAGVRLARRLLNLLESLIDSVQLADGLEYAKTGQIIDIEFRPGLIEAHIQGTAARPYQTNCRWPVFNQEQWRQIIDAMTGEAGHAAKLLAGELPARLDELLGSLNPPLSLLPADASQIKFECTCPAMSAEDSTPPPPCKHVAALAYVAAERMAQQPLLMFSLLGLPSEQLLEELQHARTVHSRGIATAHSEASFPELQLNSQPLEACIDDFWRSPPGHDLSEVDVVPPAHHIPHALLRRLGPSTLNGRFPLVGLLASVYDVVADAAAKLRSGQQPSD